MSDFTPPPSRAEDLAIGSWWKASDGGNYGHTILAIHADTQEVEVMSTQGVKSFIDAFKLQYRYHQVTPSL